MTSFSKVLRNSFKVIYHNQTTIETFEIPAIKSSPIKSNSLVNVSRFWNIYFFCDVIISKLGKKGPKVVYHVLRVIERLKSIFARTLK